MDLFIWKIFVGEQLKWNVVSEIQLQKTQKKKLAKKVVPRHS